MNVFSMDILGGNNAQLTSGGQSVAGTVVAALEDGRYSVRVGASQVTVSSPEPLLPQQAVNLRWDNAAQTLTVLPRPAADNSPAVGLLLPDGEGMRATFSVTASSAQFVALARENPEILAQADISYHDGAVTLRFGDGRELSVTFASENTPAAAGAVDADGVAAAEAAGTGELPGENPPPGGSGLKQMFSALLQKFFPAEKNARAGNFALQTVTAGAVVNYQNKAFPAELTLSLADFLSFAAEFSAGGEALPQLPLELAPSENGAAVFQCGKNPLPLKFPENPPSAAEFKPGANPPGAPVLTLAPALALKGNFAATPVTAQTVAQVPALDKFIMMAGLTPTDYTRAAGQALLDEGLAVERSGIQTLLALTAGRTEPERAAMLAAGARMLRMDIPLSPAVAAGSSLAHAENGGFSGKIVQAGQFLQNALAELAPEIPSPGSETAAEPPVENAPHAAENFPPAVKTAIQTALDALENLPLAVEDFSAPLPEKLRDFALTCARETLARAAQAVEDAAGEILLASPKLCKLDAAINFLLARLNHEPPGGAEEQMAPSAAGDSRGAAGKVFPDSSPEAALLSMTDNSGKARAVLPGVGAFPAVWRNAPGHNTVNAAMLRRLAEISERIVNAQNPELAVRQAQAAARELDAPALRELVNQLQTAEREGMAQTPGLSSLADAAAEIRDMGRLAVAVKAENLATQQNDPGTGNFCVPFKLGADCQDGRLQMFYRPQAARGSKNWSHRIVLDLDFSALGAVVGDMRFTAEKKLSVVLGVSSPESLTALSREKDTLAAGLGGVGFACQPEFRVLQAAPAPETGASAPAAPSSRSSSVRRGGIDIQA